MLMRWNDFLLQNKNRFFTHTNKTGSGKKANYSHLILYMRLREILHEKKIMYICLKDIFMQWSIEKIVSDSFSRWHGAVPDRIIQLPASGSSRQYFRITAGDGSYIMAFNPDGRENKAFIAMSRHFHSLGFPVPEVLAEDPGSHLYLLNDLGDTNLFALLPHDHRVTVFDDRVVALYRKVIGWLPLFQTKGAAELDFSICYPRRAFDRHSMMWDLNFFKYYFLKISGIPFDEQLLEDSFEAFTKHLLQADGHYFMYRDFQSRNVMIVNDEPWFIDFQGGRQGPLQYDIASLLFDAKANIPFGLRIDLLNHYIEKLSEVAEVDEQHFRSYYYDFVLIRVMQALATYGFRGGVEKKPLFLQSMPYALNNLKWLAVNGHLPEHNPYLAALVERTITTLPVVFPPEAKKGLNISIKSFSYRKGIPTDLSGNGGGFVFDCRVLPNPGRIDAYRPYSGLDAGVISFLEQQGEVKEFLESAKKLVINAIKTYVDRGFEHLTVNFGCTGGQHRSVYCAEKMAAAIKEQFQVHIDLQHEERNHWPMPVTRARPV